MHDVFYFTDIHGYGEMFDAIMSYCYEQNPEAMIIFGGDACDRGTEGYRIMNELLDNPKVVYLKGNHEDMFVQAAYELKDALTNEFKDEELTRERVSSFINSTIGFDYRYEATRLAVHNGGKTTLTDWVMDGMDMEFVEKIEHLPLTFSYEDKDFAHSGYGYKTFKEVADAEYEDAPIDEHSKNVLLWGRSYLDGDWQINRTFIFGHTPTPYLDEFADVHFDTTKDVMPIKYHPEHIGTKIDMDTGAIFTYRAFVLNILTMKAQGFEEINNAVEKIEQINF